MKDSDLMDVLLAHTGNLRPASGASQAELNDVRRAITASLRSGQTADEIGTPVSNQPVSISIAEDLEYLSAQISDPSQRLRIARRQLGLGGTKTAEWAAGMRASQTFGPFLDELGRPHWFDVFLFAKPFRVQRGNQLLLVLPIGTTKKPAEQSLTIPAGTVWIRANQLASPVPPNSWVGIRVKAGTINIPLSSTVTNAELTIQIAATLKLQIELDPPSMAGPATDAGTEATHAKAKLPERVTFDFGPLGIDSVQTTASSLSVYGNDTTLTRNAAAPAYETVLNMLLIPLRSSLETLKIESVHSKLFRPGGTAPIQTSAWGLTVTISQPENLGTASGAGALVLVAGGGLAGSWLGLNEGEASLAKTFIAVDGLSLVLVAPSATHFGGQQTLELWEESGTTSRSTIDLQFPRAFFLSFVSGRNGLDSVAFEASLIGHFDRPLRVDGRRFPVALKGTVVLFQQGNATSAAIEAVTKPQGGFHAMAIALTNALLTITPTTRLFLNGNLSAKVRLNKGTLALASGVYHVLPILPDPYAANFEPRATDAPLSDVLFRTTVTWPDPQHPTLEIVLDTPDGSVPQLLPQPNRNARDPFTIRRLSSNNLYWLLDVSSGADQLGVSLSIPNGREDRPDARRLTVKDLALQLPGDHLYTFLLPQFQWEPVHNTNNPDTFDTEQQLVSSSDGGPSFVRTETVKLVPVAPVPVARELVRAYNEDHAASRAVFTLPFGIEAGAVLQSPDYTVLPKLKLLTADFDDLQGARQISIVAGARSARTRFGDLFVRFQEQVLFGHARQTDNFSSFNPDSTLGQLKDDFNATFLTHVPIERVDLSGYGASIFSRWVLGSEPDVGITQVSFDGFNGRTSFERIQMVTILWPCISRMVRTIVLERQGSGTVLRWDSGWLSTSPGLFVHKDFAAIHKGVVEGMYEIREVRDTNQIIEFPGFTQPTVKLQAVYYDADIAFAKVDGQSVVEAGANSLGRVPARRQLGFVQRIPIPKILTDADRKVKILHPKDFANLLQRVGSLGGPIDCRIRIGNSQQRKHVTEVYTARGGELPPGSPKFAVTVEGTPVLQSPGKWSFVRVDNTQKSVQPMDPRVGIPLIKKDGGAYRWADPADLVNEAGAKLDYGLLMAHDTQRFLLQRPKIEVFSKNISSSLHPRVADPYSMLASTGVFPRVDQAIDLGGGVELVASTLKLVGGDGKLILAAGTLGITSKKLINLPAWQEQVDFTKASLFIDSLDDWKIQTRGLKQKLEFDVIGEVMHMVHDFESIAGDPSKVLEPKIGFPPLLDAVKETLDMLRRLAPAIPGGIGPFKLSASFEGTTFRLEIVADFKIGGVDGEGFECGMGKARGNLKVGAELSADIIKRDIGGAVFLEISGSWQQLIFPAIYGGGHLRFFIRGDHAGKTTLELDACAMGSIGGTLIPGLIDLEATVKYGYFLQVKNIVLPGVLVGMEGRAKLLSGLVGFKFGVEGRALVDPTPLVLEDEEENRDIRLYGRIRVAGTVTVAWAIEKSKSFETDFNVNVNWKTALLIYKAGLLPVP